MATDGQVTQLLKAMQAGDAHAAEELLPLVYAELHRLARSYMRRERKDHTLQATALINEAYLRLAGEAIDWKNHAHFIGLSAQVMRRVLVDYARAHNAEQRGGGLQRVEMQDEMAVSPEKLEEVHPRRARVVELRYFGGLSFEEIGTLLDLTSRTAKTDWALARIWLNRELQPGGKEPEGESKI